MLTNKFYSLHRPAPSLVALYCLSSDSQHNPCLRIGAGHSIVTNAVIFDSLQGMEAFVFCLLREPLSRLFFVAPVCVISHHNWGKSLRTPDVSTSGAVELFNVHCCKS